jgi:hypothetical protein
MFEARLFGDRYRGLKGWNFEDVTRDTPPAEKDGAGNDLMRSRDTMNEI